MFRRGDLTSYRGKVDVVFETAETVLHLLGPGVPRNTQRTPSQFLSRRKASKNRWIKYTDGEYPPTHPLEEALRHSMGRRQQEGIILCKS